MPTRLTTDSIPVRRLAVLAPLVVALSTFVVKAPEARAGTVDGGPAATAGAAEEPGVRYDDGPLVVGDGAEFVPDGRTWGITSLTYGLTNTTPDLGPAATATAIRQALDLWSAVSPLTFTEVPDCGLPPGSAGCAVPDIRVLFGSGDHGDAFPFGGPRGALAHAFYPPPNGGTLAGDSHFDEDENWNGGFDLVTVAAHEFGHALGLDHAESAQCPNAATGESALMCPFYTGPRPFLGADDVAGIQALYPGEGSDPPGNDDFVDAEVVSGAVGTATGSTLGAGKEGSEPDHAGNAGGSSIWFDWTAPISGDATFDTVGSGFDTLLGVYTGPAVGALAEVASNDDGSGLGLQSRLSFPVSAGTTYRVAVDGFGGAFGSVVLNWSNSCPPHGLSDVPAWVEDAVCWIVTEGHATGYPDGTYRPDAPITRAQVTRMLHLIAAAAGYGPHGFVDVPPWVEDAVRWIKGEGHATGYPDGTYRPDAPITRGQVARMLHRIAGEPTGSPPHGLSDVAPWLDDAVRWLVGQGHASGYPDGTFRPNDPMTRVELTRVLFLIHT